MLKRKRTKGSGSQALIPEENSKREAPVERLWERSREGRKETNRELSMRNRKEADGKPAVDEGEKGRGRKKPKPGREPTARQRSRGLKGRSRGQVAGREAEVTERERKAERKIPEERSEGKHLRNSCGSESGKGERKHTARLST